MFDVNSIIICDVVNGLIVGHLILMLIQLILQITSQRLNGWDVN